MGRKVRQVWGKGGQFCALPNKQAAEEEEPSMYGSRDLVRRRTCGWPSDPLFLKFDYYYLLQKFNSEWTSWSNHFEKTFKHFKKYFLSPVGRLSLSLFRSRPSLLLEKWLELLIPKSLWFLDQLVVTRSPSPLPLLPPSPSARRMQIWPQFSSQYKMKLKMRPQTKRKREHTHEKRGCGWEFLIQLRFDVKTIIRQTDRWEWWSQFDVIWKFKGVHSSAFFRQLKPNLAHHLVRVSFEIFFDSNEMTHTHTKLFHA